MTPILLANSQLQVVPRQPPFRYVRKRFPLLEVAAQLRVLSLPPPDSLNMSLSPAQAKILSDCADAVQTTKTSCNAPHVMIFDNYVVKFNQMHILNEGDTQAFVYKAALKDSPNAPRVPEVYECFSREGMRYLAMECVDLPEVASWINAASESERQSRTDISCEGVATALTGYSNSPLRSTPRLVCSKARILLRKVPKSVLEAAALVIHASATVKCRFATLGRWQCRGI